MTDDCVTQKSRLVKDLLGVDYDSAEYRAKVIAYNNRTRLKYDIQSGEMLRIRRLLREGNIDILDKDNQGLLADFIDKAVLLTQQAVKEKEKRPGRPHNDEILAIKQMQFIYESYNYYRDEGYKKHKILTVIYDKLASKGKAIGKKRIEQLYYQFSNNPDGWLDRLSQLYYWDKQDLRRKYLSLIRDKNYFESTTDLSDMVHDMGDIESFPYQAHNIEHQKAIKNLAAEFNLCEDEIIERITRFEFWRDEGARLAPPSESA